MYFERSRAIRKVQLIFSHLNFTSDVNKPHGWDAELPLHWAISERAPLFIIEALLEIYPEGARSKGRYGALPLWYAIETIGRDENDLIRLIQLLLQLHPQGKL